MGGDVRFQHSNAGRSISGLLEPRIPPSHEHEKEEKNEYNPGPKIEGYLNRMHA
jgi:hypothetical protein